MTPEAYGLILLAGFGGGILRGLVGFIKHQLQFKNVGFDLKYFLGMMFLSGVIGVVTAATIDGLDLNIAGFEKLSAPLALVVGYAGGDFIENVYKIIFKQTTIYPRK